MNLGTVSITTPKTQVTRMSVVIWGPSGSGKTTLAATAPRPILWVNFDPDGTSSLMDQDDIYIADFSMENPNKVVTFKHEVNGVMGAGTLAAPSTTMSYTFDSGDKIVPYLFVQGVNADSAHLIKEMQVTRSPARDGYSPA